jgi:hypothetical protein
MTKVSTGTILIRKIVRVSNVLHMDSSLPLTERDFVSPSGCTLRDCIRDFDEFSSHIPIRLRYVIQTAMETLDLICTGPDRQLTSLTPQSLALETFGRYDTKSRFVSPFNPEDPTELMLAAFFDQPLATTSSKVR